MLVEWEISETHAIRAVYTEGVRSLYQEDPRRRSHPRAICFLYSVYIQRVVLVPTAKIFLVLRSS